MECYQKLHLQKKPITLDTIRKNVFGKDQEDYTLCKLIAYHNKGQAGILAEGTLKNYYTTERYVHKFLKAQYKATDRYLSELSYNFIMQFERYLRTVKPAKGQRQLNNNGVMKHIERFRKIITQGVTMEWLERPICKIQAEI